MFGLSVTEWICGWFGNKRRQFLVLLDCESHWNTRTRLMGNTEFAHIRRQLTESDTHTHTHTWQQRCYHSSVCVCVCVCVCVALWTSAAHVGVNEVCAETTNTHMNKSMQQKHFVVNWRLTTRLQAREHNNTLAFYIPAGRGIINSHFRADEEDERTVVSRPLRQISTRTTVRNRLLLLNIRHETLSVFTWTV